MAWNEDSKVGEGKAIWVPMLNNASHGKDLPEKQMIVLGGTPDQQREFLETLDPSSSSAQYNRDRRKDKPPISNRYALGYTYQDVFDVDHEDILARLSIHMLSAPAPAFAPLLKPLLTPQTVPNTLIVVLLDWSDPFKWARQLRQWVRLIRSVILALDEDTKIAMEENMTAWKERRVGPDAPSSLASGEKGESNATDVEKPDPIIPLGPGEWEDGLGVPLSVICLNADRIERMEKEFGWQDDEFDFVLQWMRCVLLKHGASLGYTTSFDPSSARTLIHSSLSIQSLLKRDKAKHNVIERDSVLVPPNWDSWGKIRILGENFEIEAVGDAWSVEIQTPPENISKIDELGDKGDDEALEAHNAESAVSIFESALRSPANVRPSTRYNPHAIINTINEEPLVTVPDTQTFLAQQAIILEQLKGDDEKNSNRRARIGAPVLMGLGSYSDQQEVSNAKMAEHIGPYKVNVGGIQVDAEEMTRRIQERAASRAGQSETGPAPQTPRPSSRLRGSETPDGGRTENEALASFFANLMKKGKGEVSPRSSPVPES